jgi:hypothetical protein
MGIKERERRVEAFFYGLFMDEELLRGNPRALLWSLLLPYGII